MTSERAWFESELTTRGTEIDPTATVGMGVVLRYFEHLRWSVMTQDVLGLNPLIDEGHFFVVRSQTVELRQRVGLGVRLRLRTRFWDIGRATAQVIHEAIDPDGTIVARARVLGVWLGPERRMARLPDGLRAFARAQIEAHAAAPLADNDPAADRPARIASITGERVRSFITPPRVAFAPLSLAVEAPHPSAPPTTPIYEHALTVPPRDHDVFSHVNAATWLAYADDARWLAAERGVLEPALARGYVVRTALFYAREASAHDRLRVVLGPLAEDGGAPFADTHALGVWVMRDEEPDALCTLRLDLAPGARPVTTPRSPEA